MPKYLIRVTELPNNFPYMREPAGTNQVQPETFVKDHVASFIMDQTNTTRMTQFLTDVNAAITTGELA